MQSKVCSLCKQEKSIVFFGKLKSSKDGLYFWCKECKSKKTKQYYVGEAKERRQKKNKQSYYKNAEKRKEKSREWHHANKDKARNNRIKRIYGIEEKEYEMMARYQENKCAICKKETKQKLVIDHDHSSGDVRGLLCANCNSALGYINDNRQTLENMIDYLTDYPAQFLPIKKVEPCLT